MTNALLHSPVAGFVVAALAGVAVGLWLMQGYSLKDKLMIAGLTGTIAPVWLEAARLAWKGIL